MRCLAVVFVVSLIACGEEADERENPNNVASPSAAVGSLTDPELVGILQATIAASSAMAEAGHARVTHASVRELVVFQATNATNATANVARIAEELAITAETSTFATEIAAASTTQMTGLQSLPDTGFDDAFLVSVADAQTLAAATFADSFVGSGSRRIATLVDGMHDSLALEAGFSLALQGDFDATDFLLAHEGVGSAGSSGGGALPGTDGDTDGTGTGAGDPGTDTGDTGTDDAGAGAGSGSDGGLGGDGTATGSGQDPGGAVGTGRPNDDGDPTTP